MPGGGVGQDGAVAGNQRHVQFASDSDHQSIRWIPVYRLRQVPSRKCDLVVHRSHPNPRRGHDITEPCRGIRLKQSSCRALPIARQQPDLPSGDYRHQYPIFFLCSLYRHTSFRPYIAIQLRANDRVGVQQDRGFRLPRFGQSRQTTAEGPSRSQTQRMPLIGSQTPWTSGS